jgi:two-component system, OmpR family, alkaline phosphatase synthesis response regulator PhoP
MIAAAPTRVLVVEDQRDLALGLRANLEVEGYEVAVAHTGADGVRAARELRPDLIVLDLMLPDTDGYDVLATLRRGGLETPVLILTARSEEVDKVRGFRSGADDYVTKPFGVMELLVRIQAILRRCAPRAAARAPDGIAEPAPRDVRRVAGIEVDVEDRTVRRGGAEVPLTPKAFDLLLALIDRRGRVASRHDLLRDVWGYGADVTTRTVDAHIAELRRKLEDEPASPRHILTVWKTGYRLRG